MAIASCWRWAAIRVSLRRAWISICRSIRSKATRSRCRSAMPTPVSTVLDETYKVAVRVSTTHPGRRHGMELGGFDLGLNPRRRETLELVVNDLFPGWRRRGAGEFWTGLRPMTPDSTPIVSATSYPEPVSVDRARHPRLDHGLWFRQAHGSGHRAQPGDSLPMIWRCRVMAKYRLRAHRASRTLHAKEST